MILALLTVLAFAEPCELTDDAVMRYEQRILTAIERAPERIDEPLLCLLKIQDQGEGMTRYLAHKFLRPLLGGELPQGLKRDPRYALVTRRLEQSSPRVVSDFARGDWNFYRLFCEQGDTQFCPTMVPDEKRIRDERPLLAAAGILKLRQAYLVLTGEPRQQIAQRIKNLYETIPVQDKIQRAYIDQVYAELFGNSIPLSRA